MAVSAMPFGISEKTNPAADAAANSLATAHCAFLRDKAFEEDADAPPCCFDDSLGGLTQECLEPGEDLLDRIEVVTSG